MQQTKNCSKCKKTKSILEFWFRKDQNNYRANCKECCSKLRKKYYKKNIEKLKKYWKEYRLKNLEEVKAKQKKRYYEQDGAKKRRNHRQKNKIRERLVAKKYRLNNPDKFKKWNKEKWQRIKNNLELHKKWKEKHKINNSTQIQKFKHRERSRKHYKKNIEYYKIRNKKHYEENKNSYHFRSALRRKEVKIRTPKWANLEKIKQFYLERKKGYHVDHIVPLQGKNVSGLHVENNLQYLTAKQNISKGNKYFE